MSVAVAGGAAPRLRSFSRRLATVTLLCTLALAVAVTAGQLALLYRSKTRALERQIDALRTSALPSLSSRLWMMDADGADQILRGMLHTPGVDALRLEQPDGLPPRRLRAEGGGAVLRTYTFPLVHDEQGREFALGVLRIDLGDRAIRDELWAQAKTIALSTFVSLGGCWALLMLLLRVSVTRHLVAISDYARGASVASLDVPLQLRKARRDPPDEFDDLVLALNRMRESIRNDLLMREQYEARLAQQQDRLETVVAERTSELRHKTAELEAQTQAMQHLANTDPLTGLSNRRAFYATAAAWAAHARVQSQPVCAVMIDIDHFKRFNDAHGHGVGDVIINAVAEICRAEAGGGACVGRLGGEEFALLLRDADIVAGRAVAERVRAQCAIRRIHLAGTAGLGYTVSAGVAELGAGDAGVDAWMKRADDALYAAKRSGRDRVIAHGVDSIADEDAGARLSVVRR